MIKTYFINSTEALYDDVEFAWFQSLLLEQGVLGDSAGSMGLQVTQNASPDMNVLVSVGKALTEITKSGRTFKVIVENDASVVVPIAANSSGNNRVDAIVVRVSVSSEPNVLKNNVGTIERVAGTGTSPLTDGEITTALGSDGWQRLADVTVADAETTILNADIADTRVQVELNDAVTIPLDALTESDTTTASVDQSQTGTGVTTSVGQTDGAGNRRRIAQSFIPTKRGIQSVRLFKKANTGTFTGDVAVSIQADVAGVPSGTPLASYTISNARYAEIANDTEFQVFFSTQYDDFVIGATYWIVVIPSTGDSSNHANLGAASSNPYANGEMRYYNTIDGWTLVSGTDLYFKTVEVTEDQIVKTNDEGDIPTELVKSGGIIFTDFVNGSGTSGSTANITYVDQLLKGIFKLYGGIKIRLYFNCTTGNQADEFQVMTVSLNGTTLFTMTPTGGGSADGVNQGGYVDIFIRCTGSLATQEYMAIGQINNSFKTDGGNTNPVSGASYFKVNGTGTIDLSSVVRLLIQMRNDQPDANLNHGFNGVIIEKWG